MLTLTFFVSSIFMLVLALFVLSRNRKSLTNILFAGLVFSEIGWVLSNYLTISNQSVFDILFSLRLILFFVVIHNSFFYLFAQTFPNNTWTNSKIRLYGYIAFSTIVAILTISPYVFVSAEIRGDIPISNAGFGIVAFILHTSYSIILAFSILFKKLKSAKGENKSQLELLIITSVLTWIVVPLTNFLFTQIFSTTFFLKFSPIYTLLFAVLISYTIISQRLFDIKAVVARSVGYILTIGAVAAVYTALVVIVGNSINISSQEDDAQRVYYLITAIIASLFFQPFKSIFDKFTKRIFFRDAYDPQEVLDSLNKNLVNNIKIEELLTKSALIIQDNLKSSFCTFFIRSTSYFPDRVIGAHDKDPTDEDAEEIQLLASKVHSRIILTETEGLDDDEIKLNSLLAKNNITIMARLVSTLEYEVQGIGYIFMGAKRSGSLYAKQDIKLLEIIANELVLAVENALKYEEIEQFNVTLQKKIDDATKELQHSNEKLKALDEAKDEFVSMASHQLRTPLTSIKGYISMVLEGDAGKITPSQKKMLGQAFYSSQRMVYLISDLLNVSRLKTGKFIIEPQPVSLSEVIESELFQLHEGAEAKNIKLNYDKPKDFPILNLDEMKIRQVIMNFTDNAIYYTKSGGKIQIKLKETPKTVEFIVTDSGIGVPKHEQHKLFTKFYRADNAKKARPDGTGLGLFMAKKVIIAQGGSVIFESTEGKGSTFGFSFSKDKNQVINPPIKPENPEK